MSIKNNVIEIMNEIEQIKRKKGFNRDMTICAATKYVDFMAIRELFEAGIKDVGENRVEALLQKKQLLPDLQLNWHMIGTLQSRKVKDVINHIDCLHSLDRLSLALAIEQHRLQPLDCLIQVNCSDEISKHGLSPVDVPEFIQALKQFDKINIVGFMTLARHTDDEDVIRQTFKTLKEIQMTADINADILSMGMSNDYQIAIEEGATIIRIGSKLFK